MVVVWATLTFDNTNFFRFFEHQARKSKRLRNKEIKKEDKEEKEQRCEHLHFLYFCVTLCYIWCVCGCGGEKMKFSVLQ